jgi:hypothetical protein
MHRAPKWRSQLRTRQRARVTLNATWLETPAPSGPAVPTTPEDAPTATDTTPSHIDDGEETPHPTD